MQKTSRIQDVIHCYVLFFSSRLKSLLALGRLLNHCRQLGQVIRRRKAVLNHQGTGPFLPSNIDTGVKIVHLATV